MVGVITNLGKNLLLYRVIGVSKTALTYFSVGDNSTAPNVSDTSLTRQIPIYSSVLDDCDVTTGWTAGTDSTIATTTSYYKSNNTALTLNKTGTSGTNCSAYKTLISQDFTNKDLWIFIYISSSCYSKLATSNSIQLRYGSNSSNYYYININKSSLTTGWNAIMFNFNNKSGTTGTPTITVCTFFYIQYTTTNASDTTSTDDFVFDVIQIAQDSNYYKAFSSGYPIVTEATNELTIRYQISSTEANGFEIQETGIFNNDTTKVLYSHDNFTAISKNNYVEIIIEQIDTLS